MKNTKVARGSLVERDQYDTWAVRSTQLLGFCPHACINLEPIGIVWPKVDIEVERGEDNWTRASSAHLDGGTR